MKSLIIALIAAMLPAAAVAGSFDARAAFGVAPGNNLDAALKRAGTEKKRVLLIVWNSREKKNYPGLEIQYFAELEETKKLLKENFILVLLDRGNKEVKKYMPDGNIKAAQYVLISPDGKAIKSEAVYGNPDEGLIIVKELMALP